MVLYTAIFLHIPPLPSSLRTQKTSFQLENARSNRPPDAGLLHPRTDVATPTTTLPRYAATPTPPAAPYPPPTTPLTHDAKPPAICLAGARRPLRASPLPCRRASSANYDRTPPASRRKAAGCLPRGRTQPPPCRAAHLRAPSLTRALWQHATAARSKATSCLPRGRTQPPPCRASRLRAARACGTGA